MAMDTAPRTVRFLSADILTSGYRVVGKVPGSNTTGVIGMLNDGTHSSMEVHDARLARLHMPTKLVDHFEIVRLMKREIFAVCMARREDLGPLALVRGGYANITEYPVRITTPVFEIEGKLEIPGRFDFPALMNDGSRVFIPVFQATLTAILIPSLRVESPGMLLNRDHIASLALLSQRVKVEKQP
jgi:hypothetical protein